MDAEEDLRLMRDLSAHLRRRARIMRAERTAGAPCPAADEIDRAARETDERANAMREHAEQVR